jgi:DNA-binding MarR family transcriptional regulator
MPTTSLSPLIPTAATVDLRDPAESDHAFRIALAWRELRRGASASALRDHFFGTASDALDPGQMDTLDLLLSTDRGGEGWRMSELADALHVDPSTATRAVQRLVNDGLAERRPSREDGRVVTVVASSEGRRRHAAVARRRVAAMQRLLGAFDADERKQLASLLERFVQSLDELVLDLAGEQAGEQAGERSGDQPGVRPGAREPERRAN